MVKKEKVYKTPTLKASDIKHSWYILDAAGKTLGRFACEVARILRGKHKPAFTPSMDCGDGVIVINADKVRVTGNKEAEKVYRYHTGAMSGLREVPYRTMKARNPAYIIENAVYGMMSKSRLGKQQVNKRLRVYAGAEHGMEAQKPIYANI
jgi:large subunit ribosomal protein L13